MELAETQEERELLSPESQKTLSDSKVTGKVVGAPEDGGRSLLRGSEMEESSHRCLESIQERIKLDFEFKRQRRK